MPGRHKFTGTVAPATTPSYVGDHYTDTVSGISYISVGTSSSADWKDVTTPGAAASHTHAATDIVSGTIAPARLGSGSGGSTKFLREDSTFQTIAGGGDALVANPLSQFAATTSAQLAGVISDDTDTAIAARNALKNALTNWATLTANQKDAVLKGLAWIALKLIR